MTSLYSEEDEVPTLRALAVQVGLVLSGNVDGAKKFLGQMLKGGQYLNDFRSPDISFWVNFHHGDDSELEASIKRICLLTDERADIESGYTEGLMNTSATAYAKLCSIGGRKIDIQDPTVPAAWLNSENMSPPIFMFPELTELLNVV